MVKWKDYARFAESLQGSATVSVKENGKEILRYKELLRRNGSCKLYLAESLLPNSQLFPGQVYCVNDAYYFSITRLSEAKSWVYEHSSNRDSEVAESLILRFLDPAIRSFHAPICLWTRVDLITIASSRNFRARSARRVLHDGEQLAAIEFDITPDAAGIPGRELPVRGGMLVLDPDRYWCLRAADVAWVAGKSEFTKSIAIAVAGQRGEFPVPTQFRARYELSEGDLRKAYVVDREFDLTVPHKLPSQDEFTLSAFGLPEPWDVQQAAKKPTRWFLWLTLAGVAFLAVGAFFYYRARRRAGAA